MKTRHLLAFLVLCWAPFAAAQSPSWRWQNPLPQGNTLAAVHFVDVQTGWATGEAGTIVHTADGGATWAVQPSGATQNLSAVHFVDAQTGWAVGGNPGVILHTRDGGETWQAQQNAVADQLRAVHFVGAQTGWVAGLRTLWRTTDGGATWTQQATGPDTNRQFSDVFFADAQTGWLVGDSLGIQPLILRTSDGGATWTWQDSGFDFTSGRGLAAVHFIDAQTGWAAGRNTTMLHTTDGGLTWTSQHVGLQFGLLTDVHFTDAARGWASTNANTLGGNKAVLVTTDGGATWTQVGTGAVNDLLGVHFADASNGWVVGVNGEILGTTDGGLTWAVQTSGTHETFWDVAFADSSVGLAVGPVGFVYLTTDGGRTWSEMFLPATISEKQRGTSKHCILVLLASIELGEHSSTLFACILEIYWGRLDGVNKAGKRFPEVTWTRLTPGTNEEIWAAAMVDSTTAWMAGTNGVILHTRDAGQTWNLQASGVTVRLEGAFFLNADQGWMVGAGGTILHTKDGGASWSPQTSSTTQDLRAVYFLDAQRGWATGRSRTFLRTTDGGQTWTPQPLTGTFAGFYDIDFSDGSNGWLVGDLGAIFHTSDGGETWTQVPSGTTNALLGVDFVDAANGWISGDGGTILRLTGSSNAAPTVIQPIADAALIAGSDSLHLDLNTVFSDADGDALTYAAGSSDEAVASATLSSGLLTVTPLAVGNATITVTAEDGRGGRAETAFAVSVPTGVAGEGLAGDVPEAYALESNYPNPFRTSTAIRFEVPQAGRVQVQVFDVLGRVVETLLDEQRPAGSYTVAWEAASAPSGVYFYRLQTGTHAEMRKMVLMR